AVTLALPMLACRRFAASRLISPTTTASTCGDLARSATARAPSCPAPPNAITLMASTLITTCSRRTSVQRRIAHSGRKEAGRPRRRSPRLHPGCCRVRERIPLPGMPFFRHSAILLPATHAQRMEKNLSLLCRGEEVGHAGLRRRRGDLSSAGGGGGGNAGGGVG